MNGKKHVASFYSLWLVVLRCFEIPLTEAEPWKGRELLAKRGEQKIRKNQVQAARSYIEDRGAPAKTANTSTITNPSELFDSNSSNSNSALQGACDLKCV